MIEYNSFGAFAAHLARLAMVGEDVTHHVTEQSAKIVEENAQLRIGIFQSSTGPFNGWADLADSTKAEKERLGYVGNAPDYYQPLLRTGDMRDSIETAIKGNEAVVGSKSDIALYQEVGTEHIPPRPFLGPAGYDSKLEIGETAAAVMIAWISGLGWRRPRKSIRTQLIMLP